MPQRSVVAVGASLLVASLALAGCGTRGDSGSDASGSGSGNKTVKIGVIAPLSGDLAALGLGIKNSVDLAIKQANENKTIPGWTFEIAAEDDEAKPDVGKNAATKLVADKDVVGVVGTLNSSVAQSVQPVLSSAKITEVSPANTNPSLTQGADFATAPKRTYPNYFRTCTTDAIQGPFAAHYLFEKAGIKEVATVNDKKTYGQGLVDAFTDEYKKLGGKIVAAETINPDDDKYDAVITKIKPANPKAVYYGGEFPQAGPFSQQMKAAGLNVPLMGGDGIYVRQVHQARRRDRRRRPRHLGRRPDRHPPVGQGVRRGLQGRSATRSPTRPTAPTPTTPPTPSSRPSRSRSPARTRPRPPARPPSTRCPRSPSTASPARSPSTSSATPPTRC